MRSSDKVKRPFLDELMKSGWVEVPKIYWPDIVVRVAHLTPIGGENGTHCYDNIYRLDDSTLRLTYEYQYDDPLNIEVKVINYG